MCIRDSDDSVFSTISVSDTSLVSGSGTSTITVDPLSDLAEQTSYYVQLVSTVFDDVNSNSYAGINDKTSLSFTTAHETSIATFSASEDVTWSLPSGDDITRFRIDSSSGELFFANPTNNSTTSSDGDNQYVVVIRSTETDNTTTTSTDIICNGANDGTAGVVNPQGGTGVVKIDTVGTLVEGQVSVHNSATVVTIETCFAKVGTGTPACATGNAESTMKNEIQIE